MNIWGRAFKNGIKLQSNNVKVIAKREEDGKISFVINKIESTKIKTKNKFEEIIYKIPIIRGFYDLVIKNDMLFVGVIYLIGLLSEIILRLEPIKSSKVSSTNINATIMGWVAIGLIICLLGILLFSIKKIKKILEFHGAEHKVINAHEEGKPNELYEIKKCSRVCYNCGSIYAILLILSFVVIAPLLLIFIKIFSLTLLIIIGVAHELFTNDKLYKLGVKYIFKLGGYLQKIMFTREPDDGQIEVGIACLNKLKEEEGKYVDF